MPISPRLHISQRRRVLATGLACLLWTQVALGEIYKFVDENGHVTYTNLPRPGANKLQLGLPGAKSTAQESKVDRKRAASNPTPGNFPRVDPGAQEKRDDMRRKLLLEELGSEQRGLSAAQSARTHRPPGSEFDRLTESVRLHEKNIEMLNKELGHLR